MPQPPRDLARTLLALLFMGALIYASVRIMRPFIVPAIWATMIVVTTWPALLGLQHRLWGRRGLAVTAMTLILLLAVALPLTLAGGALLFNADDIVEQVRSLTTVRLPVLPDWLVSLPYIGPWLAAAWQQWGAAGVDGLLAKLQPYAGNMTRWLLSRAGNAGFVMLEFLLTLLLATVMYAKGEPMALTLRRFGRRLAGEQGEQSILLAARAMRGVALGVGVTAVVQSGLGGLGLAVAGVPFAGLLTALMFVLCLAQIGPSPVLLSAVVWIFWGGSIGWGIALAVWALIVSTMDNLLRPWLIQKGGVDMPLLLVFIGVVGGLLAFGLVGIFVGPVVLAVAFTLLQAWIDRVPDPAAPPDA